MAECTLKESAAINQILGRRWHALDRTDQAKYYELARRERAIHLQKYPGKLWQEMIGLQARFRILFTYPNKIRFVNFL